MNLLFSSALKAAGYTKSLKSGKRREKTLSFSLIKKSCHKFELQIAEHLHLEKKSCHWHRFSQLYLVMENCGFQQRQKRGKTELQGGNRLIDKLNR